LDILSRIGELAPDLPFDLLQHLLALGLSAFLSFRDDLICLLLGVRQSLCKLLAQPLRLLAILFRLLQQGLSLFAPFPYPAHHGAEDEAVENYGQDKEVDNLKGDRCPIEAEHALSPGEEAIDHRVGEDQDEDDE
jgi:hypothetical protein